MLRCYGRTGTGAYSRCFTAISYLGKDLPRSLWSSMPEDCHLDITNLLIIHEKGVDLLKHFRIISLRVLISE